MSDAQFNTFEGAGNTRPIKILLADDEPFILRSIRKLLPWADLNCEIIGEAQDGSIAMQMINELEPNIFISDIRMPGMSGIELLRNIRYSGIPIRTILISSHRDFAYAREAIAYGAIDYLLKPVKSHEMRRAIFKALENNMSKIPEKENLSEALDKIHLQSSKYRDKHLSIEKSTYYTAFAIVGSVEANKTGKLLRFAMNNFLSRFCATEPFADFIEIEEQSIIVVGHNEHETGDALAEIARGALTAELDTHFDVYRGMTVSEKTEIHRSCLEALGEILRKEGVPTKLHSIDSVNIHRALEYISNHYSEKISLKIVADVANMNPSYFSSQFKKVTGINFKDFLSKVRVEAARDMLLQSELTVYEIAEKVGLSKARRLGELFREHYYKNPSEYRHEIKRRIH